MRGVPPAMTGSDGGYIVEAGYINPAVAEVEVWMEDDAFCGSGGEGASCFVVFLVFFPLSSMTRT